MVNKTECMNAFEKHTIEIIGVGKNAVYSIGKINLTKQADVYLISKIGNIGLHLSRHKDGEIHLRTKDEQIYREEQKRIHIKDFDGIEYLGSWAFGIANGNNFRYGGFCPGEAWADVEHMKKIIGWMANSFQKIRIHKGRI